MLFSGDCIAHTSDIAFPMVKAGNKACPQGIGYSTKNHRNVRNRIGQSECNRCGDSNSKVNSLITILHGNLGGRICIPIGVLQVVSRMNAIFIQDIDNALLNGIKCHVLNDFRDSDFEVFLSGASCGGIFFVTTQKSKHGAKG